MNIIDGVHEKVPQVLKTPELPLVPYALGVLEVLEALKNPKVLEALRIPEALGVLEDRPWSINSKTCLD